MLLWSRLPLFKSGFGLIWFVDLYGITMLKCPPIDPSQTLKSLQRENHSSSLLSALNHMQRRIELGHYVLSLHSPRTLLIGTRSLDVQGGALLEESGGICAIRKGATRRPISVRFLSASSFIWCSQDDVVVEVRG